MKIKLILVSAICSLLCLAITGCVSTVEGRSRAGVPFKKDKIEGRYERPISTVFAASKVVLNRFGKVNREDTINHTLYAKVDTRDVFVKVNEVDTKISAVIVQVRTRGGGADVDLAAQIEKEIALQLVNTR